MTYSGEYARPFCIGFNKFEILNRCEKKIKTVYDPSEERDALPVFTAAVF